MKKKKPKRNPRVDLAAKVAELERRIAELERRPPFVLKVEPCRCRGDDPPPQPTGVPTAPQQPWWPPGTVTRTFGNAAKIGTIVWGTP